jgi:hypothetical protein
MVPSANTKREIMDYLISYELINQGSKRKMNTTQRVSVNAHKMMNFARHQINIGIVFKYMIYFVVLFTWVWDDVCWCSHHWSHIMMQEITVFVVSY